MLIAPEYKNRKPSEIIEDEISFDSVGYIYRSLSWLDYAKNHKNICALQYSALECRYGIEQLLFEELVLSVGTNLDKNEYEKCKGQSTKLRSIIRRLSPDYTKLVEFTKTIMSTDPNMPEIQVWDHNKLMKHWGKVSTCLHWAGAPEDTFESKDWINEVTKNIEYASMYIWKNKVSRFTAIMIPDKMAPEIRHTWLEFKNGKIDLDAVKRIAKLALPILAGRERHDE